MTTRSTTGGSLASRLTEGLKAPLSLHAPVLSLTLMREGTDEEEVLIGVRTRAGNRTHQEVVSVPTMRIAPEIAGRWPSASDAPDELVGLNFCVEALLARKLGVADALELGSLRVDLVSMRAFQGTSLIDHRDGTDVTEQLTMFAVTAIAVERNGSFPVATASYEPLLWVARSRLVQLIRTRDVDLLGLGSRAVEMCVRGLCIETTKRMLQS